MNEMNRRCFLASDGVLLFLGPVDQAHGRLRKRERRRALNQGLNETIDFGGKCVSHMARTWAARKTPQPHKFKISRSGSWFEEMPSCVQLSHDIFGSKVKPTRQTPPPTRLTFADREKWSMLVVTGLISLAIAPFFQTDKQGLPL
jgi:hypothetical protein